VSNGSQHDEQILGKVPSAAEQASVLVVEDEQDLCKLIAFNLAQAGFSVTTAHSGAQGLIAAAKGQPIVVVLDIMLPDISGLEVCRHLRNDAELSEIGILMITARADERERVEGLEVGADDYVTKPFNMREIVLRVQALARRCGEYRAARNRRDTGARVRWRGVELDISGHRIYIDGEETGLRPMEFKLLALLMEHRGEVLTRERMLESIWEITADVNTRTVDTHVRRLRQRLGVYGDAIETVYGFGYRLEV